MTDRIEKLKLAAKALELRAVVTDYLGGEQVVRFKSRNGKDHPLFDPYTNDAQAMALVKALGMTISTPQPDEADRTCTAFVPGMGIVHESESLNDCVIDCAAAVMAEREKGE